MKRGSRWCSGKGFTGLGFESLPGQSLSLRFLLHMRPLVNSAVMRTLLVVRQDSEGEDCVTDLICHDQENEVANTSYQWLPQG